MFNFKCIHCQTVSQTVSRETAESAGVEVYHTPRLYVGACYACSHGHTVVRDNGQEEKVKGFLSAWQFGTKTICAA